MAIFGHFGGFWPGSYRAIFSKNGQKWPFWPKTAKNGVFGHNSPFWAILALFGPRRAPAARGFTSTPAPPAGEGPGAPGGPKGLSGPRPEGLPGTLVPEVPDPGPGIPAPGGPGAPEPRSRDPGTRRGLRTPPRGWFYINPSRRGPAVPAGGPRDQGSPGGPRRGPREADFQPRPAGVKIPLFLVPGNRGAPARGVDVKPPPGTPTFPAF